MKRLILILALIPIITFGQAGRSPYVTTNSAQTITGQKNFSNNKTVFGTTTNDSVGVRGRVNVGRKITVGSGNNLMSFDNATLLSGGALPEFNLKLNDPLLSPYQMSIKFDYLGMLTLIGTGIYTGLPAGNLSFNGGTVNSSDINWLLDRDYAIYSMNGLRTDGDIYVDSGDIYVNGDINVIGNYYRNGVAVTASGSVGNADSLGNLPASDYVTKSGIDGWSTNLYTGSANVMRLGKSYNDKRFNNGAYSDVWNIDYVVPPYNLSASWLYSIEHRTDYYNDTLQTVSGVANLLKIDGTGTPIWKASTVTIAGQETQVNVGELPDSATLNYSASSTIGNNVILSEENMAETPKRYPMQIKGYNFRIGANDNYTFPKLYSYYSDLSAGDIEDGYHFYGNGNYPSYFGGNILTDGYISVQDSIIIGSSTVKIYPDSVLVGGVRLAKITEAGGLDTSVVNALIEANEDSTGSAIIGTVETLDSLITDYWNDALGGSTIDTTIVNALIEANEDTTGSAIIGTTATLDSIITAFWNGSLGSGATWDSTYAYQRIVALETNVSNLQDSISSFRTILNSILTALDTCGCGADLSDNTPTAPPTSLVAHGGEYETQVRITWTDPTAGDLDSIRIYRHTSNDSTGATWIASVAENIETYTNTGRTANTTYWYWTKALDDSSNLSYFSNSDSATTQSVVGAIPVIESFTTDSVVGTQRIVLSKPSGVQADDLLLIVVASEDPNDTQQWNNTTNKPTGFTWASTTISGETGTGRNDCQTHIAVFWKIATGSETDTIGIPSVGTGNDQVGYYLRISGVNTASPLDVWDSPLDSTYYQLTDTIQIHSQTTNYDNELALVVCANDGGNYGLTVETAGWSAVDDNWVDDSEYGLHLIIGEKEMPTAGATGQCIIKNATKTPNGSKVGMIITIRSE